MSEQKLPEQTAQQSAQPVVIRLPGNSMIEFPPGFDVNEAQRIAAKTFEDNIDRTTGAPVWPRMKVGNARTPEDKLSTLMVDFPESIPYGDNFLFVHPETKKWTLFNPEGLDFGDVAEFGRTAVMAGGATVGGVIGALAGPASPYTVPAAAGGGAAMGGQVYDLMMNLIGGQVDSRSVGERTVEAGMDWALTSTGEVAAKALPGATKKIFGATGKKAGEAGERLAAFTKNKIKPLAGEITGSPTTQAIQSGTSKVLGGANTLQAAAQKAITDLGNRVDDLARGNIDIPSAGEALQRGASSYMAKFRSVTDKLYARVAKHVQPDNLFLTPNTRTAVGELSTVMDDMARTAKALTPNLFKNIADDLDDVAKSTGAVKFSTLQRLRTEIGAKLSDPVLLDDVGRRELKQLYASLTQDMLEGMPTPAAKHAFQTANKTYKQGIEFIESAYSRVLKKGVTPEQAYSYALQQSKLGGSRLWELRRGIPKADWDVFAETVLNNMGKKASGELVEQTGERFNPVIFFNNWNGLSKGAKQALFSGNAYSPALIRDVDELANLVAGSMKDTAKMANPSGTAPMMQWLQLITGGGLLFGAGAAGGVPGAATAAGTIGAGAMSAYGTAKLLTNPKVIKWLITPVAKNGVSAHIGRLVGIATADPLLREPVAELLSAIGEGNEGQVERMREEGGDGSRSQEAPERNGRPR